jgi:monoamine oxidase
VPRSLSAARRAVGGWHPDADGPPRWKRQALYDQGLLPGALDPQRLAACNVGSAKVAVVGGGFAGAAAAWYLFSAGIPVTLFEATRRVGGRVSTDRALVPRKVVEAGAELIGANHPMWFELAGLFGLNLAGITFADEYEPQGLRVRLRLGDYELTDEDFKTVDRDLGPVLDSIGRDAFAIDPVAPWASAGASTLDTMTVAEGLDRHFGARSSLARSVLEFLIENDNCAPVERQSYLGLLALVSAGRMGNDPTGLRGYWDCTETHRCAGGNDQLAIRLTQLLGDVRLASPVDKISISAAGVGIDWSGPAAGSEDFDFVILASPPTSWPDVEGPAQWNPRQFSISQGPAIKFLSSYDRQFWRDAGLAPSALWTAVGSVWEGTDRQATPDVGFGLSIYAGGPYISPGPNCAARLAGLYPGVRPSSSRYVDWPHAPYVRTGYAIPAPGQITTVGRALSGPYADRLFFAGEQASMGFFGYMEGALQSGARAASRVVERLCPGALPSRGS